MDRRDVLRAAAAGAAVGALGSLSPADANPESAAAPRLTLRRSQDRGQADHGWLKTYHSFSFASYHDRAHMGFRGLRVINEDWIAPTKGFPMHPHDNMEIVTYVLEGALEHKDSLGNGGVIVPGVVQRMSAGSGIRHSEFNPSAREQVHLLQIWMQPNARGVQPGYEDKVFPAAQRQGVLRVVASPDGRQGSIRIHADNLLYAATLRAGEKVTHAVARGRHMWLQVARGSLTAGTAPATPLALKAGDGARTSDAGSIPLVAGSDGAEILLFDLA